MSLQSMTGFGKSEAVLDCLTLNVEIKSVNHRFKDLRFKMPGMFNSVELDLRRKIDQKFRRGSFDIFISFKKSANHDYFSEIDEKKVTDFIKLAKKFTVAENMPFSIDPVIFLKAEFQKDALEQDSAKWPETLFLIFDQALNNLEQSRKEEGEKIRSAVVSYQTELEKNLKIITSAAHTYRQDVTERLQKKIQEWHTAINVEENRLLQEIVYYLEKLDVDEELTRLQAHLEQLTCYMQEESEIGRKVDFLLQELNRETNTIGAKAQKQEITTVVVLMKVLLEKIREQALNIE